MTGLALGQRRNAIFSELMNILPISMSLSIISVAWLI